MRGNSEFLNKALSDAYLAIARSVARSMPVIDAHVHATEVIRAEFTYEIDSNSSDVWSTTERPFLPPVSGRTRLANKEKQTAMTSAALRARVSQMVFTQNYQHCGPGVFEQHMDLAGVTHALLLPVARRNVSMNDQMSMLHRFSLASSRFLVAYSLMPGTSQKGLEKEITSAMTNFRINAVKIHPNISNFDLKEYHDWMETALSVCGKLNLPVIVHGGRSPIYRDRRRSHHAILENLQHVDWSVTDCKVVIAHFGVYGYTKDEVERGQTALLNQILERHENIILDTSGVGYEVLHYMLSNLDHSRIIYGSDALYCPMWESIVMLLHALHNLSKSFEESFVQIASKNPFQHLKLEKKLA